MPRLPIRKLRWFHATRALGTGMILYGLLIDETPERGSIILGGLGLLGFDKVARGEEKAKDGKVGDSSDGT